ncbi:MAG: hypothetical protein ABSG49_11295 [Methanoregula sp.]|uniref:hypothetical protein n=1 Tax=Methanoregula sp. TaxID=2052170 RepID=UPI003C1EE0CA
MKITYLLTSCILLVLLALAVVPAVNAADIVEKVGGVSYLYVTSVTMDPEVFYPYEQGSVTVTLTNNGNSSIGVTNPNLLSASNDISIVKEDEWHTMSYIASGNTISYTFLVTVNGMDGKYFALFTAETKDAENLHYPMTFEVDSEDMHAAISKKPETFTVDSEAAVNLSLINPRDGVIKSIYITTEDNGSDITPTQTFVSELPANSVTEVPFTIIPHKATNITFNISYQNGDVRRETTVVLPIVPGNGKNAAVPTINNLALTSQGMSYDLTGDITNTGISDANGVVATVGLPAKGTGTYPEYAVGSLASDDSSSFEITFTSTDLRSVPLLITWKDAEGTDYSFTKTLDLSSSMGGNSSASRTTTSGSSSSMSGPGGTGGPGGDMSGGPGGSSSSSSVLSSITSAKGGFSSFYPVIAMFVLIIVGVVAYVKRKWIMSKLKKQ